MRPDQWPRLLFQANLLRFRAFPVATRVIRGVLPRTCFKAHEQLALESRTLAAVSKMLGGGTF
jgi:hypothetical protein